MPAIAHLGDGLSHGGSVTEGSPTVSADGLPVARVGDTVMCSQHGAQPIITGEGSVLVDGRAVAHHGSMCACGALIIADSQVSVGGGL